MTEERQVPVRTMCAMFGLKPDTVRTWERRYQFPSPARGAGGHRLYSETDIELIRQITSLMNDGMSPGKAIAQVMEQVPKAQGNTPPVADAHYQAQILEALEQHDHEALTLASRQAQERVGYQKFIETYAFPMLQELGRRWEEHGKGVAAEHAYTRVVANVIAEQANSIASADAGPIVTFACVPGEQHDLPLLHLNNLVRQQNLARPIVLAAGLPMDEIIDASRKGGARLVLLSATMQPASVDTRQWVARCVNAGWTDRVLLAGPGFARSRVYLEYPVKAATGSFSQVLDMLRTLLKEA